MEDIVVMSNITKKFGNLIANSNVSFTVRRGEIHALIGENGAGKTTLMNILYGLIQPDEGSILINGQQVTISGPADVMKYGIGMAHQHVMLVPTYSVLDNVILGREPRTKWGTVDWKMAMKVVGAIAKRFGLETELHKKARDLSIDVKQMIEVIKLLYREAQILIFDEATATLSPQGTERFLKILKDLNHEGKTIILISHKLPEVMAISNRITVMRKGCSVMTLATSSTSEDELVKLMIHDLPISTRLTKVKSGEMILKAEEVSVVDSYGYTAVKNVSFQVKSHEIVAIAGVEGNGQSELAMILMGLLPAEGKIFLAGRDITEMSVAERRKHGMAFVPEDRTTWGLVARASLNENAIMGIHYQQKPILRKGFIDWKAATVFTNGIIQQYNVKSPGPPWQTKVSNLSGGNMQKLLLGREVVSGVTCLIISQPTRGLDIGARNNVYDILFEKRDAGCAILIISNDLDEVFTLADRILVMYKGELVADFLRDNTNHQEVGFYMTGLRRMSVG